VSRTILVYSANPADYPDYPDPCPGGGNHDWKPIYPFTTAPGLQDFIGKQTCHKCREIADIPARGTQRPVPPDALPQQPEPGLEWLFDDDALARTERRADRSEHAPGAPSPF
jgi:hypothetical protein